MKKVFTSLLIAISSMSIVFAQLDIPRPSPLGRVYQNVGLNEITIEYSRPGVKGREIFGGLVPYGQLWRTGANAATKLTIADDAVIGGKPIPAGEYSLLTIPGESSWTIIINKDASTNTGDYQESMNQATFTAKPQKVTEKVETFTINIADIEMNKANIELVWANTKVSFPFETEVDKQVMEQIKKATAGVDPMVYYRSAVYYYDTDKDLEQALEWMNKALEGRETYFMLHSKAKLQAKMGDKKGAIETAQKSKELAMKENNESFITLNDDFIAEMKKKK